MKVLFIHNNFPAQYRHLATVLAQDPNNKIVFATSNRNNSIPNVVKVYYEPARAPSPKTHHYLHSTEKAVLHSQAMFRLSQKLKQGGFIPDIVCAHSGWGPSLLIKEIFPDARVLSLFEWYYQSKNSDFDFLPEAAEHSADDYAKLRFKNTPILHDLVSCDGGVSPTHWQRAQFPEVFKNKISVIHDGINTDYMRPAEKGKGLNLSSLNLADMEEIVTYVARGMEPYRGFPTFMRAVSLIQKRRKKCHVLVVGEDRVAYGRPLEDGKTYKQKMLDELELDHSRLHFTGPITYGELLKVYQASSAHVYLSVPFVLSWSMLEAMSSGCIIVGSDTPPVKEVIKNGENGFLVDFFSPNDIADRIETILDNPDDMPEIRKNARDTILENYSLKKLLPKHIQLVEQLVVPVRL